MLQQTVTNHASGIGHSFEAGELSWLHHESQLQQCCSKLHTREGEEKGTTTQGNVASGQQHHLLEHHPNLFLANFWTLNCVGNFTGSNLFKPELDLNLWSSSRFRHLPELNHRSNSRFMEILKEPDWTRLRQHYYKPAWVMGVGHSGCGYRLLIHTPRKTHTCSTGLSGFVRFVSAPSKKKKRLWKLNFWVKT